jgi:hypothetical protein
MACKAFTRLWHRREFYQDRPTGGLLNGILGSCVLRIEALCHQEKEDRHHQ